MGADFCRNLRLKCFAVALLLCSKNPKLGMHICVCVFGAHGSLFYSYKISECVLLLISQL